MKRRLPAGPGRAWGLALVGVGAGLVVLPFLVLLRYAHPALDDFGYASHGAAVGFGPAQQQLYLGWTGRYLASALLTVANPLRYQWLAGYWLGGGLTLLLWWLALALLVRRLLGRAVGWAEAGVGGLVLLALSLAQLPSPAEGPYWLAGTYTYLVPLVLTLGLFATLLPSAQGRRPAGQQAGAALLVGLIMGGNEVNGVLLLAGLLAAGVLGKRAAGLWPLVGVGLVGAAVAWGAPGNFVRLHTINHQAGLLRALLKAASAAAYCLLTWLGSGVLPLVALLLAAWVQQRAQGLPALALPLDKLTRRPVLLTALVLGLLVLSFLPSYWATDGPMPRRARNAVYALFVVGWLLTTYGWLAWYWRRYPPPARWPWPVLATALGWLGLALLTDHNVTLQREQMGVSVNSTGQAYRDWLSGDAARYHAAQQARYHLLRTTPAPRVLLPLLPALPRTLYYADISYNPLLRGNQAYAAFFGKQAVWVGPQAAPLR